jgi:hypothetical protein
VFTGYEGAVRLQLIEDQQNPYLPIFTRQVKAGARTVFEKKAFTMLYFRENVEHLKTLYSPKTLNYVVTAQDEGVCYLMSDMIDEKA